MTEERLDRVDVRKRVRQAFADLRRAGFTARMDFGASQSMARHELTEMGLKDGDPHVFFHKQAGDALRRDGTLAGSLMLHWGHGKRHARAIIEALTRRGLATDWEGKNDQAIQVVGIQLVMPDGMEE